jgi:hypothetical protein
MICCHESFTRMKRGGKKGNIKMEGKKKKLVCEPMLTNWVGAK